MEAHRLSVRFRRRRPFAFRLVFAALVAATLAGCAAPRPAGARLTRRSGCIARRPPPNLLSGQADLLASAREFAFRSDWPSTPIGIHVDDVTRYSSVVYDDQTYFDELGGVHERIDTQVRTGLVIRD